MLVPVDFGVAANIQEGYILIIAAFCEDGPQIVVNDQRPFTAHFSRKGMIA